MIHITATLTFILSLAAVTASATDFVAAGAPRNMTQPRNYNTLFTELRSNGIDLFFPTFQFQEQPDSRSLGYEVDFLPPCSADDPAFIALRKTGMKLIISGDALYPDHGQLPKRSNDPLQQLLECAGSSIYAVSSYDEAPDKHVPLDAVRRLYERVKDIAPELPVLMVNAPMLIDKPEYATENMRQQYLADVITYARYADIVGFDLYPIPQVFAQIVTPQSKGVIVDADKVVPEYLDWQLEHLSEKPMLIALQGFAIRDMFEPAFLRNNFSAQMIHTARPPSRNELEKMITQSEGHGIELIIWWGQAALVERQQSPWPAIISLSNEHSN